MGELALEGFERLVNLPSEVFQGVLDGAVFVGVHKDAVKNYAEIGAGALEVVLEILN